MKECSAMKGKNSCLLYEKRSRCQAHVSFFVAAICTTVLLIIMLGVTSFLEPPVFWTSTGLLGCLMFDWLFTSNKHHRLCFLMFWFTGVAFCIAFWWRVAYPVHMWLLISILAIGIILFLLALPHIEKRLVPVGIIGMTMTAFVWAACEWWLQRHSWASCSGMLGAILFSLVTFRVMVSPAGQTLSVTSLWVIGIFQLSLFCIVGSVLY